MECRDVKNLLSEYIDGTLSGDAAAGVKAHLEKCDGCAETYDEMTRLIGYMREMETVEEPADLLDNVRARLERPFSPMAWLRRLFTPAPVRIPVAATVIVIVAMIVFYLPGVREGRDAFDIAMPEVREERKALSVEGKKDQKGPAPAPGDKPEPTADAEAEDAGAKVEKAEVAELTGAEATRAKIEIGKAETPETWGAKAELEGAEVGEAGFMGEEVEEEVPAPKEAEVLRELAASRDAAATQKIAVSEPPVVQLDIIATEGVRARDESAVPGEARFSAASPTRKRASHTEGVPAEKDVSLPATILALGGTMVSGEFDETGRFPDTLVVHLPVDSVPSLLKKLEELGWVAGELPEESLPRTGTVTVKICPRRRTNEADATEGR